MPATGADIPPELFPFILAHVDPNIKGYHSLPDSGTRDSGAVNCSLVCLSWAQQCRCILFRGREIQLSSMKQAAGFRELVTMAGNATLEPVLDMIASVSIDHDLRKGIHTWFHLIGSLIPRVPPAKFGTFRIQGSPERAFLRPNQLRSPYWDSPRHLAPFITPYQHLALRYLHFGSASDVVRLASHFTGAKSLDFRSLTWSEVSTQVPLQPQTVAQLKDCPLRDIWLQQCKDSLLLWQLLAFERRSFLQSLCIEDQQAIFQITSAACAAQLEIGKNLRFVTTEAVMVDTGESIDTSLCAPP